MTKDQKRNSLLFAALIGLVVSWAPKLGFRYDILGTVIAFILVWAFRLCFDLGMKRAVDLMRTREPKPTDPKEIT